jgi:YihY family inner membrane protein
MTTAHEEEPEAGDQREPLPRPLDRLDRLQQRFPPLAVAVAVVKKFGDDDASSLASLVSYYAFLSVFPLLIVLATVVSRVLAGYPELADEIVRTAAGSFLSVGGDGVTFVPLDVSGLALVVGLVVGLWSGLAVANTMQTAMDTIYEVPKVCRSGLLPRLARSVLLLVLVGVGLPLTTVLQGIAVRAVAGPATSVVATGVVLLLNTAVIATAFRQATVASVSWRSVLPGAAIAAVAWAVMQSLATGLLTSRISGAQSQYGTFAVVVGLLFWFFLLAQVTLYCAELNTVLAMRLWPRGLRSVVRSEADTDADRRAYAAYPRREAQAVNLEVEVTIREADPPTPAGQPAIAAKPTDG